jgi:D-3-phosphoglycerate dehydrogenase
LGTDLYRKTVGVVGLGRVGRSVVKRLAAFETRILVCAPRRDERIASAHGLEYADLATLLRESDYLTLHAPLTAETRFMIREETLRHMKPSAFLINTARGGLVEDRHLLAALEGKSLAGAGLDTFTSESDPAYKDVTLALAALPNVVVQPHSGASTREGLDRTNLVAAQCVVAVLNGTALPPGCVVADGRPLQPAPARACE